MDDRDEIAMIERMLFGEKEDQPGTSNALQPGSSRPAASSLVKPADGDSSDDEDQRDFQNCKYNDYGRTINKKLKEREEARKYDSIRVPKFADTLSGNKAPSASTTTDSSSSSYATAKSSFGILSKPTPSSSKSEVLSRINASSNEPPVFCDPIFGLRIIQPLISSITLKEKMAGKVSIGVRRARFHTERGDVSKDWAIAGVVVTKSPVKQTQKGDSFMIWSISDLHGDIKTVSVFLFQSAYKELWKSPTGSVVAILNPKILDRKDDKVEAVLAVDNHQKVMILGTSKDLGFCKSKKNNGDTCGAIINKNECDVCIFHMKREYSKIKRSEFQSPGSLQGLRNKVLGKSEVFYAGQSYTAMKAAKKPTKMIQQDRERLMTLSEYFTAPYNGEAPAATVAARSSTPRFPTQPLKRPGAAAMLDTNIAQRKKDWEMLKKLQGTDTPQMMFTPKLAEPAPEPPKKDPHFVPKLSSTQLTFTCTLPARKVDMAKQRAAAILKQKPLEPNNPNLIRYRGTEAGKKRLADRVEASAESDENGAKRMKFLENEEARRKKEYIERIMGAKSSHAGLVVDKEAELREKCFDTMEKKEAMEEKMAATMEMPCKAVICKKCKYIYFSASSLCKEQRHELKVVDAVKRFYECADCKTRTVTLFKIPRDPCKNCNSRNFKRTGMIKGREAYVGEQLSIRGDEELFIGGAVKTNINLLVPETQ